MQFIANTKDAVSATCCYAQRLLSWQVAEAGQKNKIELQWADITSLRVTPMVSTSFLCFLKALSTYRTHRPSCHNSIASASASNQHAFGGASLVSFPPDCICCKVQGPATELLEVDVQSPPGLYQETSPAVWQRCHDFTGGEASCLRYASHALVHQS